MGGGGVYLWPDLLDNDDSHTLVHLNTPLAATISWYYPEGYV
jgi:hypothetical protein